MSLLREDDTKVEIEIEHYSVIYSVDWKWDKDDWTPTRVHHVAPPKRYRKEKGLYIWQLTELDDQADGECFNRHRKWCALLTPAEFDEFVEHCGLVMDTTPTMGSIGAPGFGFGWAPAVSFNSDSHEYWANAYVTPIPLKEADEINPSLKDDGLFVLSEAEKNAIHEALWDQVVEEMLNKYGDQYQLARDRERGLR